MIWMFIFIGKDLWRAALLEQTHFSNKNFVIIGKDCWLLRQICDRYTATSIVFLYINLAFKSHLVCALFVKRLDWTNKHKLIFLDFVWKTKQDSFTLLICNLECTLTYDVESDLILKYSVIRHVYNMFFDYSWWINPLSFYVFTLFERKILFMCVIYSFLCINYNVQNCTGLIFLIDHSVVIVSFLTVLQCILYILH